MLAHAITSRARFFWFLGGALALYGVASWFTIAKEEDPRIKPRFATINVIYPGATPEDLNKYVVREIEKEFTAVTGLEHTDVLIRSEFAFFRLELKGSVATDAAITKEWDDVDSALRRAELRFPRGVFPPQLNRKALDQESMLVAITGSDAQTRHKALIDLELELLKLRDVAAVTRIGDEGRQISLQLRREALAASGLTQNQVIGQLSAANGRLGGGSVDGGGFKMNLRPLNAFSSVAEIAQYPLTSRDGGVIRLGQIASVTETDRLPVAQEMRWNGEPAYALGVVGRESIDLVVFGDAVVRAVEAFKPPAGVQAQIINSQPAFVRGRLRELSVSLLESMLILGVMMFATMGLRLGLVVTVMLPIISLIALSFTAIAGGVLQQISIAAFVMSLGLLIDNIIVVAESVQEQIDRGTGRLEAATHTVGTFAVPLLSSTLTTVASFLPMLLAKGSTSEFTFAIPAIAITTLSISWLAAVYLTPSLAARVLKRGGSRHWKFIDRLAEIIADTALIKRGRIALGLAVLVVVAALSAMSVGQKFFPSADRAQLVIEVLYPEGTALSRVRTAVGQLEQQLGTSENVKAYASFIGRSTPRFYYNLNQQPNAPHLAQILVMTSGLRHHAKLRQQLDSISLAGKPRIIVRSLEQGPPIPAPVEIRLIGNGDLQSYADALVLHVAGQAGAGTVRHDSEGEQRELVMKPRDTLLAQNGITRYDFALATLASSRGVEVGYFRNADEALPLVVTYPEGEQSTAAVLNRAVVGQTPDRAIRLGEAAGFAVARGAAVINRRDRESVIRFLAEADGSLGAPTLLSLARDYINANPLPAGARYEIGGEVGESLKANGAIMAAMPLAMIILIAVLIWEFNSLRLTMIILTAVPTAGLGVMPGLAIGRQPFGFMAMLSLFALIGIVVNNGILLIDRFKSAEGEGRGRDEAVRIGIRERLRPILLTSGSTILGMVPLTFTDSTLWPPFAWAMISGLGVSTLFTLFIVPWLYSRPKRKKPKVELLAAVLLFSLVTPAVRAEAARTITLGETIEAARRAPAAKAAWHRSAAARAGKHTEVLGVWGPRLTAGAEYIWRDREFFLQTPLGQFPYGRQNYGQVGVELYQTLWSADGVLARIPVAEKRRQAAEFMAQWEEMSAVHLAISRYFDCAEVSGRSAVVEERLKNLAALDREVARLRRSGRGREIDTARLDMKSAEARLAQDVLADALATCHADLGRLTASEGPRSPEAEAAQPALPAQQIDLAQRPDLRSLETAVAALAAERDGVLLESLPEIYARGNYTYFGARQFTPEDWFQASIGARWRLLDGGTQVTRRELKSAQHEEKQQQLQEARQAAQVQLADTELRLRTARRHESELRTELEAAELRLRREKARVDSGRTPATDLLDTYDLYWKRREAQIVNALNLQRLGWTYLYLAGGLAQKVQD